MTIESNISAQTLLGDGEARSFPFTFKAFAGQVKVIVTAPDGKEEDITSLCSINLLPSGGGVVTYPITQDAEALPFGYKLTIMRNMDFLQETQLVNGARYSSEVIEQRLDKLTAQDQQLREEIDRTLRIGVASEIRASDILPEIFVAKKQAEDSAALAVEEAGMASGYADLARKWASNPEDEPVEEIIDEEGLAHQEYSAKHWARKAAETLTFVQNGPIATPELAGLVPVGGLPGQVYQVSEDGTEYGFKDLGAITEPPLATPSVKGLVPAGGQAGQVFGVNEAGTSYGFLDAAPSESVPSGVIVMWSGAVTNIPVGWLFCDGTNGTPDLRSRFIICGSAAYPVGSSGGTVSHNHTITVGSTTLTTAQMPSHTHATRPATGTSSALTGDNSAPKNYGGSATSATGGSGSHTHTGSSATASNLPPYYALAYIMKA